MGEALLDSLCCGSIESQHQEHIKAQRWIAAIFDSQAVENTVHFLLLGKKDEI